MGVEHQFLPVRQEDGHEVGLFDLGPSAGSIPSWTALSCRRIPITLNRPPLPPRFR
jgi:hypothetical protein